MIIHKLNSERQVLVMENENNMNQESGSTYHYGRNESPFGKEDVSGKVPPKENGETNNAFTSNNVTEDTSSNTGYTYYQTDTNQSSQQDNPYRSQAAYGQGIYTGNDFSKSEAPNKQAKNKKPKKPMNKTAKKAIGLVASAAVFGLVAGGIMVGVNAVGNNVLGTNNKSTEIATVTTSDSGAKDTSTNGVADVAKEVMPSIVSITSTSVQTVQSWFQSFEQEVSGSGSGIIIGQDSDNIMIVTNYHVIEGAKELTVAFCDETAVAATVKGYDSAADLAVITVNTKDVDAKTREQLKVAALGSSDDLLVGESAIAIGNALGYGQSVTVGYISALDREVDVEDSKMNLLQTDAAINPGNSGGALLNGKGEVIGINTVKYVDSTVEGMGYAIPISTAIPIINDLMNQEVIEESEQGYLGIQGNDVTEEYAQGFNMPTGVYVAKIVEDSPADQCGLKAGDIITKFGDREVTSMETLQNILSNKQAGDEIKMVVQRNNEKGEYEEVTLTVTLGAKKDMPEDDTKNTDGANTEATTEETEFVRPNEGMNPYDFFFQN